MPVPVLSFSVIPSMSRVFTGQYKESGRKKEGCSPCRELPCSPVLPTSVRTGHRDAHCCLSHLTPLIVPGPRGTHPLGEAVPLLEQVLLGEDPEDELRLLASLRCAGHDDVRPWLQPQLPTHFFF